MLVARRDDSPRPRGARELDRGGSALLGARHRAGRPGADGAKAECATHRAHRRDCVGDPRRARSTVLEVAHGLHLGGRGRLHRRAPPEFRRRRHRRRLEHRAVRGRHRDPRRRVSPRRLPHPGDPPPPRDGRRQRAGASEPAGAGGTARGPAARVDARGACGLDRVPGARPAGAPHVRRVARRRRALRHRRGHTGRAFPRPRRARRPRDLESVGPEPRRDIWAGVPGGRMLDRALGPCRSREVPGLGGRGRRSSGPLERGLLDLLPRVRGRLSRPSQEYGPAGDRADDRPDVVAVKRSTLALISLLIGLTACASLSGPYQEYEIRFEGDAQPALGASPSDQELINTAAWLIRHKLELPVPAAIKAYVYVNQATLVDGLIKVAGETTDDAWDKGRYAAGVASRSGLFLRGDYLARMHYVGRAGLFAHELAHVSQARLREGGRGRAAQWILEGHADWVKMRVLDLLRYRPYAESRDHVVRTVVGSPTPIALFPPLAELANNPVWVNATNQLGAPATYWQAFLAIDWLVEGSGDTYDRG